MANLIRLTVVCLLVCLGCGCVSYGSKIPFEKTSKIEVGRTTRIEVEKLLGKPTESVSKDGRTLYSYTHTSASVFKGGISSPKTVFVSYGVLFDEQLTAIKTHRHEVDQRLRNNYAGGFSVGKPIVPEDITFIEKGTTRLAELEKKFGSPTFASLNLDGTVSRTWWHYYQIKASSPEQVVKLIVDFYTNDVVEDYLLTEEKVQ